MAQAEQELIEFVKNALSRGASRDEIAQALSRAGWAQDQIRPAMAAFAEQDFIVPVPRPRPYVSARDAFYYLLLFFTLGLSAYYFCSLVFDIINVTIPDLTRPENWRDYAEDGIRHAIAVLVVAFPLYLFLTAKIASEVRKVPEKRASHVRKWLTYIALFLAAVTIVCDLSVLIYQFLKGDLTIQVSLKVLTVAVVAGLIFTVYLRSVGRDEKDG